MFENMTNEGHEEVQDRLGGGYLLDTGIYTGKIKVMYAGILESGTKFVTGIFDFGGKEYRETFWVTNKKGEHYYFRKDDTEKKSKITMAGYTVVNDICLTSGSAPINEQKLEDKIVNVWDSEAKKELPKSVKVFVDLVGQPVSLGIVRALENKTEKQGDEYVAINDTREVNFVEKVFHTETKKTVAEATGGRETAEFWGKWEEKNKGETRDRRTKKDGANEGRPGSRSSNTSAPQAGQQREKKSLFGG